MPSANIISKLLEQTMGLWGSWNGGGVANGWKSQGVLGKFC